MKIVFIVPHLKISGGMRILLNYANLLFKKGHNVTLIVRSNNKFRRSVANILHLGKPRWYKNFRPKVLRVPEISKKYIPNFDVVIVSSYRDALIVDDIFDNNIKKYYFIQHDERLYHGDVKDVTKAYQSNIKKIAVANWLVDMFKKDFHQDAYLLSNTLDRSLFYPVGNKKNNSKVRILLMHHLYEWKGWKEGIKVYSNLKKKYNDIEIVMFGVRQKKMDKNICKEYYYDPPQDELRKIYSSCDIFICPSWDEGFGLPSIEAMACKCALVTYDNRGSRDFAFDGKTAMVAKKRDISDLERKLEILIKDVLLRKKIAKQGYEFIQGLPTWEDQSDKLEEILLS